MSKKIIVGCNFSLICFPISVKSALANFIKLENMCFRDSRRSMLILAKLLQNSATHSPIFMNQNISFIAGEVVSLDSALFKFA